MLHPEKKAGLPHKGKKEKGGRWRNLEDVSRSQKRRTSVAREKKEHKMQVLFPGGPKFEGKKKAVKRKERTQSVERPFLKDRAQKARAFGKEVGGTGGGRSCRRKRTAPRKKPGCSHGKSKKQEMAGR